MRPILLQSASGITKCDKIYYKVRQVLQSVSIITKCDSTEVYETNVEIIFESKFF